jgi:hypothetical protein
MNKNKLGIVNFKKIRYTKNMYLENIEYIIYSINYS